MELVDVKNMKIAHYGEEKTSDMQEIEKKSEWVDAFIFGMAVYNYSINDSLKVIIDNAMGKPIGKFFGILAAAGGQRSYLATMHLTQMCMNEWRMIQLPRVVYATGVDFVDQEITSLNLIERIDLLAKEFDSIGNKLNK